VKQGRGFYRMENVDGYVMYRVVKPITITVLKANGSEVMTDEPINWIGMQRLAECSHGNVLCAGLGLGLIVHALSKNPKVEKITVVEINKDVIDLITPFLPKTKPLEVVHDDIYKYRKIPSYNTVILDIWAGKGDRSMFLEMVGLFGSIKLLNPSAKVFVWGITDEEMNPAVCSPFA
jgi:spermidine synthase